MGGKEEIATLAALIQKGFLEGSKNLHTSLPGIIVSFEPSTQLASIQPAIRRVFKTREESVDILTPTDLPVLINVPIVFPRGGGFSLTFPVAVGDECLLVFCERAIDNWHQFGGVRTPISKRFHALSDAVAMVGLSSINNKIPSYNPDSVELKSDDGNVIYTLNDDGTSTIKATGQLTIDTPESLITGNVTINGDLTVISETILSEDVTSNGVDISDTHSHSGSPTAPSGSVSDTGSPI